MLSIVEVQGADHIGSVAEVLAANWAETGFDFDLCVSIELVEKLQAMGIMFILGAFDDGQLVGYSSAMIGPHIYNPEIICCNSDALFVLPAWRKTSAGARLIAETERVARERGANRMLWHTRAGTALAAVMEKRGYVPADTIVMKRI